MKYKRALVIGRFQPLHKGHLYLIEKSLELAEIVVIGVGSVNKHDDKNPFSYKERKKLLSETFAGHRSGHRIETILPLEDNPSDDAWLQNVIQKVGSFDLVTGNNPWNNGIFERAGYRVKTIPFYKRHIYEGTKIRKEMKTNNNIDEIIHKYLK